MTQASAEAQLNIPRRTESEWHQSLTSWAKIGKITIVAIQVLGDGIDQDRLSAIQDNLIRGYYKDLPVIHEATNNILQGHLAAYAAETNTIYVDPDLAAFPSLCDYVLTHEFGHWLAQQLLLDHPDHDKIAKFATLLNSTELSSHSSFNEEAGINPINQQDLGGQILLPTGRMINVNWFDTGIHSSWVNEIYSFLSDKAKRVLQASQNDTDAIVGSYANQLISASHFDNNDITGGLELIDKRYISGLASFNSTEVAQQANGGGPNRWDVTPGFSGADAGIQQLLYRFGQILHSFQDFYSHSNWVELVRKNRLDSAALLDDGLGLPRSLHPGDFVPGSSVMVAMTGLDWSRVLKRSGTGNYSGTRRDVYWNVNSDKPESGGGEVWGTTLDDRTVYGLATGTTNGSLYTDPDFSVLLRDPTKTRWDEKEYFRGFDHGGIAGAIIGQWVGPLNKDGTKNPNHLNAKKFANLQVQHEWDRLGNLIFSSYGVDGLTRFADYAFSTQSDKKVYVDTFSRPGARYFPRASSLSLGPSQARLDESGSTKISPLSTAQANSNKGVLGLARSSQNQGVRFVRVYSEKRSGEPKVNADVNYSTQIQYYDPVAAGWIDSAYSNLDIHDELDREELRGLRTAAVDQHLDIGKRAAWSYQRFGVGGVSATDYYIEKANQDVRVSINDFDLKDRIILEDPSTGRKLLFDEKYYRVSRFGDLSSLLLEKYNISVNIKPVLGKTSGHVVLSLDDIGKADGTVDGLAFGASALFDDPDASGDEHLKLAGYDQSLHFLRLADDRLVVSPDINKYVGSSVTFGLSVSDGKSTVENRLITLGIAPAISIPGIHQYDSSTLFSASLDGGYRSKCRLYSKLETPLASAASTFKLLKSSGGTLVDPWQSGNLSFFLAGSNVRGFKPLKVKSQGEGLVLYQNGKRVGILSPLSGQNRLSGFKLDHNHNSHHHLAASKGTVDVPLSADHVHAYSSKSRQLRVSQSIGAQGPIGKYKLPLIGKLTGSDAGFGKALDKSALRQVGDSPVNDSQAIVAIHVGKGSHLHDGVDKITGKHHRSSDAGSKGKARHEGDSFFVNFYAPGDPVTDFRPGYDLIVLEGYKHSLENLNFKTQGLSGGSVVTIISDNFGFSFSLPGVDFSRDLGGLGLDRWIVKAADHSSMI